MLWASPLEAFATSLAGVFSFRMCDGVGLGGMLNLVECQTVR